MGIISTVASKNHVRYFSTQSAGLAPIPPPPATSYTKSLLHMNGADGSTTFTDELGKTWTAAGNAQIDTAQSKFGGASGLFDGTGDYISTPDSDDFYFDADFTIDFWGRFNALPGSGALFGVYCQGNGTNYFRIFVYNNAGTYRLWVQAYNGATPILDFFRSITIATGTWYHFALSRSGNNYYIFLDGVLQGSAETDTSALSNLPSTVYIGQRDDGGSYYNGWLDEFRVSKGIARWTSNFTPGTSEYVVD